MSRYNMCPHTPSTYLQRSFVSFQVLARLSCKRDHLNIWREFHSVKNVVEVCMFVVVEVLSRCPILQNG